MVRVRGAAVNTLVAAQFVPMGLRHRLLRWFGITLAASARVRAGFTIDGHDLTVGEGTYINTGCYFDCSAPIRIGATCNVAMGVMFVTASHEPGDQLRRAGRTVAAPIAIGDGCWIGARATILPGVTLAPASVIAAGAVVARDTEPDGLYAGVPASRIRDLPVTEPEAAAAASKRSP